jgi:hypothetical protein
MLRDPRSPLPPADARRVSGLRRGASEVSFRVLRGERGGRTSIRDGLGKVHHLGAPNKVEGRPKQASLDVLLR